MPTCERDNSWPKHEAKCCNCKYWKFVYVIEGSCMACHYLLNTGSPRAKTNDDCLSFSPKSEDYP